MKSLKLIILLFSISIISYSCGNDDDGGSTSTQNNVLVFGDTEIELKSGIIENYGDEFTPGIFNFDVSLFNSEISIVNGDIIPTNETISGLYFELFTDNAEDLAVGTYTYGETDTVGSYGFGEVIMNFNSSDESGTYYDINSGTFTLLENGSIYELEFEGTTEDGIAFTGYYKGSLIALDETN